jgi:peptidoglycan/LPS O-acetylase OafA/YrhL
MQLYRPDIDGLRAVAVILVVLFHVGVTAIPGGFIGVDVFFVISGYLITGIITREIDAGQFSLARFYERRIKRILPALLVMLVSVLALGLILLLPGDLKATGRSAAAAALSVSNIYFLRNTGYFDQTADLYPLLHTWSLAVEEQFYVVWPIMLIALAVAFRRRRAPLTICVTLLALISFGLSVKLMETHPKDAFFLAPTRAWELIAGAILALLPSPFLRAPARVADALRFVGLGAIFLSAVLLTSSSRFPGVNAVAPVLGACLIVAPWGGEGLLGRLLASPPMVLIGKMSYSIYLWHWPLIVLFRHYSGVPNITSATEIAALLALTFVIAWASWRFIELPCRASPQPLGFNITVGLSAAAATAALGAVAVVAQGFPQRLPATLGIGSLKEMWHWDCRQTRVVSDLLRDRPVCILGADWSTAKHRGVMFGDSHAQHFAPLIDVAAKRTGAAIILFDRGCQPLAGTTSVLMYRKDEPNYAESCADKHRPLLDYLSRTQEANLIILAAAWAKVPEGLYRPGSVPSRADGLPLLSSAFDEFVRKITTPDRRILVLGDVPGRVGNDLGCLINGSMLLRRPCPPSMFMMPAADIAALFGPTNDIVRALPDRWPQVSLIMPHDRLCTPDGCITTLGGEFLYRDASHLRRNLSATTRERLVDLLRLEAAVADKHVTGSAAAGIHHLGPR